jgi:hypothetical protein
LLRLLLLLLRRRLLHRKRLEQNHPNPPLCRQRRSFRRLRLSLRRPRLLCRCLLHRRRRLPLRRRLPSQSPHRLLRRLLRLLRLLPPLRRQPSRLRRMRRARRPRPLLCRPLRRCRRPLPRQRLLRLSMISQHGALRCWLLPAQHHPPRTMMLRLLRHRHRPPQSRLRQLHLLLLRRPRRLWLLLRPPTKLRRPSRPVRRWTRRSQLAVPRCSQPLAQCPPMTPTQMRRLRLSPPRRCPQPPRQRPPRLLLRRCRLLRA